jgi:uncharacterized protein
MPAHPPATPSEPPLSPEAFDELDALLDDLRSRYDETPQWEFCEGFLAALVCCRRPIAPDEYLQVLLGLGGEADEGSFANEAQRQRFMDLWTRRWREVAAALDAEVDSLDDDQAYHPEVLDVRGSLAALDEAERAAMAGSDAPVPYFAQVWALGFMFAVESWPEEWAAPRDKDAAKLLDASLEAIVAMTEDDTEPPTLAVFSEDGPPSVSLSRLNAFGDAIWAVYDLRELWLSFGPRVETVRKEPTPGRNDLCFCGSGKKYKKCHGAG